MKKILLVALTLTVLAGGFTLWRAMPRPASSDSESAPGATARAIAPEERPDAAGAIAEPATTAAEPTGPPARRIRHGLAAGDAPGAPDSAGDGADDEPGDALAQQVEKALAGDTDELIGLARLLQACSRGMASEEQVLRRLDRMARFSAQMPGGGLPPRAEGGSVEYRSFEELESATWAQFDECQAARGTLDEDLHDQIERLAEAGLPTARYLFALWSPGQYEDGAVGALELLEYQTRALDYTWLNMQQRDPLGLLAMAQSYSANRPALFTPSNPIQGQVFLLAALKCGIDNEWLAERSVEFGQGMGRFQARNTSMPTLEADAVSLAEAFCPSDPLPD